MPCFRLHIILTTALFILLGGSGVAQQVTLDKDNSRVWIEGRSNVNEFSCRAEKFATNVEQAYTDAEEIDVEVDIEVEGFECGKRRMNRDLQKTLLADKYSHIHFEFTGTRSLTYYDEEDRYELVVTGKLTVAGSTREIEFPLDAFIEEDGTVRASGETTLRMTDYQVEPPTALFGIVKVEDRLTVHFELYAKGRQL